MAEEKKISENQLKNKPVKYWLWKKGQSGNPAGRPKGKTMKEYAKEYIACLTDEERDDFMDEVGAEVVWRMAEGNPRTETDITSKGEAINLDPEEKKKIDVLFDEYLKVQQNDVSGNNQQQ